MSEATQPHAIRQDEELKPHGDELENALKPAAESQTTHQTQPPANSGTQSKE